MPALLGFLALIALGAFHNAWPSPPLVSVDAFRCAGPLPPPSSSRPRPGTASAPPLRLFPEKRPPAALPAVRSVGTADDRSLLLSPPPPKVLDFVSSTPGRSSRKVIPSDLSAATGIPLSQARRELSTLASLTGARMTVTSDGEIMYGFPPDVRAALRRRSWRYRVRSVAERSWPGIYHGIRVGFGVALVASVLAIFATLAAVSAGAAAAQEEEDRRSDSYGHRGAGRPRHVGGGGVHFNFFGPNLWGPSPFDFFYYRPYYGYYGQRRRLPSRPSSSALERERPGRRRDAAGAARGRGADLSLLESVFSYVFGDGNPNAGLDEVRLRSAASFVRSAGGAVTAEQLAVFLPEVPPPEKSSGLLPGDDDDEVADSLFGGGESYVDESYVLPLVLALGGEPTVTDDGDIVYVFPEMMKSAARSPSSTQTYGEDDYLGALARTDPMPVQPGALEEEELEFSIADDTQKTLAFGLGVVNLLGAISLGNALSKHPTLKLVGLYGVVQRSFPYLLSYAVLYNVIPLVRFVRMKKENGRIRERNSRRRRWATALRSAGGTVSRKVRAARRLGRRVRRVDDEPIVFDTEMDASERDRRLSEDELRDFDERL